MLARSDILSVPWVAKEESSEEEGSDDEGSEDEGATRKAKKVVPKRAASTRKKGTERGGDENSLDGQQPDGPQRERARQVVLAPRHAPRALPGTRLALERRRRHEERRLVLPADGLRLNDLRGDMHWTM